VTAGVCRFCGCSEYDPCVVDGFFELEGCAWSDRTQTVCSLCAPAAKAERLALKALQHAGYRSAYTRLTVTLRFVEAFHVGFVVGWFAISPRSVYGRNPLARQGDPGHEAWQLGHRAGTEASRRYRDVCGPLQNAPRREVLQVGRRRDRRPAARLTRPRMAGGARR
jgi:hypothetical protein